MQWSLRSTHARTHASVVIANMVPLLCRKYSANIFTMELIISFAVSRMFLIHLIKYFDYEVYSVECSTECVLAHVCACVGECLGNVQA